MFRVLTTANEQTCPKKTITIGGGKRALYVYPKFLDQDQGYTDGETTHMHTQTNNNPTHSQHTLNILFIVAVHTYKHSFLLHVHTHSCLSLLHLICAARGLYKEIHNKIKLFFKQSVINQHSSKTTFLIRFMFWFYRRTRWPISSAAAAADEPRSGFLG